MAAELIEVNTIYTAKKTLFWSANEGETPTPHWTFAGLLFTNFGVIPIPGFRTSPQKDGVFVAPSQTE